MGLGGMFPGTIEVLTKSLSFLEARHRIIANNLANANTPFFKASEAPINEFREALARAIDAQRANPSGGLVLAASEHVRETDGGLVVEAVEVRGERASLLHHDENNVSLEREMSYLAENTLMYRTMSDLLRKQFMILQSAIRERAD